MKKILLPLAVLVALSLAVPTPVSAQSEDYKHLKLHERAEKAGFDTCSDFTGHWVYREYATCVGEVPSFDGVELEGRIVFPSNIESLGTEPLPLVVMFTGWGGNRILTFGPPNEHPDNTWDAAAARWLPARFLERGYAVLAYTPRGFAASCGWADLVFDVDADGGTGPEQEDPAGCVDGHTHIAEREYEVEDTKYLLGKLVDWGVADPDRLVAAGGSYGGGQTWMLATSGPWPTPAGRSIGLAGAVTKEAWTDFFDALAPNGRATDGIDQSRSTEIPFGVPKLSIFQHKHRAGRAGLPVAEVEFPFIFSLAGARYNTHRPNELHSFIDGWMAVFAAGEPYASDMAQKLPAEMRGKSAFYASDYFNEVASRDIKPVPIFTVQGWTDPIFPAVQSLQMYRKLKAAHPGYPISMVFGDFGHLSQKPDSGHYSKPLADQGVYWMDHATRFVDAVMAGEEPEGLVASFPTTCPATDQPPVVAGNWDALQKKTVSFQSSKPATTDSSSSDLGEEAAADSIVSSYLRRLSKETPVGAAFGAASGTPASDVLDDDHPACVTRRQDASASGARWRFPEDSDSGLSSSMTMLGLPRVSMDYALQGEDASVVAKLWDVGTDGTKTLVTRGVYRLSTAAGDAQSGTISFQLFGNHWTFPAGHMVELEVGQRDAPFFRPNNLPSALEISGVRLSVPLGQ